MRPILNVGIFKSQGFGAKAQAERVIGLGKGWVHCKRWVRVLSNVIHGAGGNQWTADPRAQVFLAYAAAEPWSRQGQATHRSAVVEALRHLLTQAQLSYWEYSYPWSPGVEAEAAISRATEACDSYLLVLSPQSLADTGCLQGLLFALSLNKRIVAVLAETVAPSHLPEPLRNLEAIDLRAISHPLGESLEGRQILQILTHEADYHQSHTQLLMMALRWERQRRDPALLLKGKALAWYQRWLVGAKLRSRHRPIHLQALYVAESVRWDEPPAMAEGLHWLKRWLD